MCTWRPGGDSGYPSRRCRYYAWRDCVIAEGVLFTPENIRERLNMRDFMDTMRASGIEMSQPPVLSKQDRQKFANALDKWLRQAA